jgi:hypothetical protein
VRVEGGMGARRDIGVGFSVSRWGMRYCRRGFGFWRGRMCKGGSVVCGL